MTAILYSDTPGSTAAFSAVLYKPKANKNVGSKPKLRNLKERARQGKGRFIFGAQKGSSVWSFFLAAEQLIQSPDGFAEVVLQSGK